MFPTVSIALAILGAPAVAADLRLTVTDATGRPLGDAVVSAYPSVPSRAPPTGPIAYRMVQQDIQFQPHVLVVPVGAAVAFPNMDRVRHHVYSFSPAKRFELKLYGRDESHKVVFDKPGTVAIGCNIHDSMSGFIRVVDTPFAARSAGDGTLALTGVPPGTVRLRIWHPGLRAKGNEIDMQVSVPPGGLRQTIRIAAVAT